MLSLLVAGLLLALSPPAAWATDIATGTLYETMESPPGHAAPLGPFPGTYIPATGERLATATEAGVIQGSGDLAFLTGNMTVHAQSRVAVDPSTGLLGIGTVSGSFQVKPPTGGAAVPAKLDGFIDLSMLTANPPFPAAPIKGTFSTLGKNKMSGDFIGLFLIPFELVSGSGQWFYLAVDDKGCLTGGVVALQTFEFRKGMPLVKLLITLVPAGGSFPSCDPVIAD